MSQKAKADFLIEVSWEVCNKVGGIYTVITSKIEPIKGYYGDNYILIGPYFADKAIGVFHEELPPEQFKAAFVELQKEGINCHYGNWITGGEPNVILIDFLKCYSNMDMVKGNLWKDFKVDSLRASNDYNEPVVWGYAVGKLIQSLALVMKDKKIVAHFHEWLAGVPLLHLKKEKVKVGTVFTTHATILGRTIASSDIDLYTKDSSGKNYLEKIDPLQEAYKYHIEAKYTLENASANNADVFTTVSEITGMEASYLLKRNPDVLLPNGLDLQRFPTFEELSISHRRNRNQIREFLMTYFFPYESFDLDNTLLYFLVGRYEFRDKGIDVFIKSLGMLNERLKRENSKKTVAAFIWVPAGVRGVKPQILENKTLYNDIKETIVNNMDDVRGRLLYNSILGIDITKDTMLAKDVQTELKIKTARFIKTGSPPFCTHDLYNENDEIVRHIREAGLNNSREDRVKMIFYPIYLSGADNLIDLNYYEAMNGCHLGVFPSFYEPWGYTPLEAGALGVESVTTDLAGFGRFIATKKKEKMNGIFVLERLNKKDEEIINSLAEFMYWFQSLDMKLRVQNKIEARMLAETCDWKLLVDNYIDAHNLAVTKIYGNSANETKDAAVQQDGKESKEKK